MTVLSTSADGGSADPGTEGGRYRSRIGTGLYAQVVEILGQQIINGDLPPGTVVYAEQLCERLGVSRSVMRESLRTLSSMGLVESRPQVGTTVLPTSSWDLLNPHLVKWRSQGPDYVQQMRELLELRLGVDQAAAQLACARITEAGARGIVAMADRMRAAFRASDAGDYFAADAEFHRLLLEGTGNPVLAQLAETIGAVLHARGGDERPGMHHITSASVVQHIELANALSERDSRRAQLVAREIVEATLLEFETLLPAGQAAASRARSAQLSRASPSPT